MTRRLSKSQIDKLGERLKNGPITQDDLRLLDEYRESFREAYEAVVKDIRNRSYEPTGRIAKSTNSIVEKLRRESIRLSQMQDIAGCRIIVENILEQDQTVSNLIGVFPNITVIDRRKRPSHGYRAVHLIAIYSGKAVEIQVRSRLQHMWGEVCEKAADLLDPAIKYGGGNEALRVSLLKNSEALAETEYIEVAILDAREKQKAIISMANAVKKTDAAVMRATELAVILKTIEEHESALKKLEEDVRSRQDKVASVLNDALITLERLNRPE